MRRFLAALAVSSIAVLGMTACSPGAKWTGPGETAEPPKVELTDLKDGDKDVSTAFEVAYTVTGTKDVTIKLADGSGKAVEGLVRPGGTSWLPTTQLDYDTTYTLTATATKSDGSTGETRATFTTMAKPANLVDVHSFIGDDQVVGVAMPIVLEFGQQVPPERRTALQQRLFVHSDPPQEGIWNWIGGNEVHYRPREYWQPNTTLDIRIGTGGLDWGNGAYGKHDLTVKASVGARTEIEVDNASKTMTVKQDGAVARTIKVSLGKPSAPSSSGTMVIFQRGFQGNTWELFDSSTYGVPVNSPDGYRTKVDYVLKLTGQGEYIHAAPWSVADQGRRNVSHGCVNLATDQAAWLYSIAKVGDPVTVKGTEVHVKWGNGWTDWDRTWDEYVKGSAIPYQPGQATPSPAVS